MVRQMEKGISNEDTEEIDSELCPFDFICCLVDFMFYIPLNS